eukprot:GHVS01101275.1.p1 GENE.GHVS01101275.1~~GHVS01101275.1.p1  ORF type:complete len:272 (-),score=70.15 GHVS01101275.1:256-1071(-)
MSLSIQQKQDTAAAEMLPPPTPPAQQNWIDEAKGSEGKKDLQEKEEEATSDPKDIPPDAPVSPPPPAMGGDSVDVCSAPPPMGGDSPVLPRRRSSGGSSVDLVGHALWSKWSRVDLLCHVCLLGGDLLVCDDCQVPWHRECAVPVPTQHDVSSDNKWTCSTCRGIDIPRGSGCGDPALQRHWARRVWVNRVKQLLASTRKIRRRFDEIQRGLSQRRKKRHGHLLQGGGPTARGRRRRCEVVIATRQAEDSNKVVVVDGNFLGATQHSPVVS